MYSLHVMYCVIWSYDHKTNRHYYYTVHGNVYNEPLNDFKAVNVGLLYMVCRRHKTCCSLTFSG